MEEHIIRRPLYSLSRWERNYRFEKAVAIMAEQRKHKDSEARRRAEIESNLTARQATALVAALIAAIEEEEELTLVIRRRIQTRLARYLHPSAS